MASAIELTLRTLLGSPNPRATELLLIALQSEEPALRLGAVRVLALREDVAGHRKLVEAFSQLPADAQAALRELPETTPLAEALPSLIRPEAPKLARRGSEVAAALGLTEALPAIVTVALACPDDLSGALAADALLLAVRLEERVRHYDPAVHAGEGPRPQDPAFARRAAVNALVTALDRFGEHGEHDLLQALLLLTPGDEPALLRALRTDTHPAHDALQTALQTSSCPGAISILAALLADLRSPQALLEIVAERYDRAGLTALLTLVGYPVGLRVRENCQRLGFFSWLEPDRVAVLADLSGPAQATAIQLASASQASRSALASAILTVLASEHAVARLAACRAISVLPTRLAEEPLWRALQAADPAVVATAVRMVRKKDYPNATTVLVAMLESPDAPVRDAAGKTLQELSFTAYRDSLHDLPPEVRGDVGRLVGKADPLAVASLRSELGAAAVSRRLKALELIGLMDLANVLVDSLTETLVADKDLGVRVECAQLLGSVTPTTEVIDALVEAVGSRASALRRAAQECLEKLTGQSLETLMEVR
ncbi:hypothetical protein Pla108_38690 [Botrimarina colliarenosi]|uniref:HEAT repeat protein n=1 Tax=Botrimarina colliarenosi TaxID=2528001 RepID=A0A5C6A1U4_9BACT|nr:HEAT repeat domain-containing protein [Botrimarina colliarenosi]TWT93375.1 hypothetical protein Pla108_38690 [Botrimarina colliarenosi]